MDTSDDFLTGGGGGGKVSIPKKEAENISRTAEPLEQVSEAGRRRRQRRRQASVLTAGFGEPQLGIPGLTGVTNPLGVTQRI